MRTLSSSSDLSRLLFVSTSTHSLGHISDLELFRSATHNNITNNLSGVILRGESWFCQVLEGSQPALNDTWGRIRLDTRHSNWRHWWEHSSKQRLFSHWRTEYWGVSPQIERVFLDMMQSERILTRDKIILVRAFAQVRRAHQQERKLRVEDRANAGFDSRHLGEAINALKQPLGKIVAE